MPDDKKSVDFLGLSGSDGVWSKLGGPEDAGRGVVVGVIDTGIWPESASFAGEPLQTSSRKTRHGGAPFVPTRSGETITMTKSDGATFTGRCQPGEGFTVDDCNTKIVGARYFGDTWLARVPANERDDVVSPRDGEGHGSHTASIAVGNHGVRAVVDDRDFGRISGVAPAAKIAAYKAVWQAKDAAQSGAYDSDVLAAIDAAIADGVDVINFSISAADDPTSPVQLAFLAAASAGIFVATSAGNSGPGASTVQSTSPWVTTVGAHTIAPYYGTVTLGNGQAYAGISTTVDEPVGPAPLVNGAAVVADGQTAANAAACAPNSLDPAKAAGTIVVCARGVVDRIVKSAEVERAGGIGMVLANLTTEHPGRRPAQRADRPRRPAGIHRDHGLRRHRRSHGDPDRGQRDVDRPGVPADRHVLRPRALGGHRRGHAQARPGRARGVDPGRHRPARRRRAVTSGSSPVRRSRPPRWPGSRRCGSGPGCDRPGRR